MVKMVRLKSMVVMGTATAVLILVAGILSGTASPELVAQTEPEPWIEEHEWEGVLGAAVSWHAEPPEVGCITQESPVGLHHPKSCGGLRSGSDGEVTYHVTDTVETVIVQLDWASSSPASTLQLDTLCPEVPRGSNGAVLDLEHPCYFHPVGGMEGPIVIRVDREHWESHDYSPMGEWAARVFASPNTLGTQEDPGLGAGYAYNQPFVVTVALYHHAPAP